MAVTTLPELKNLSEIIPPYNGDIKLLNNFISAVDDVESTLESVVLSPIQKTYLFGLIKTKLTHRAAELLSENKFKDWKDLKSYLTTNFCDKSTAETILLEILQMKNKTSTDKTLEIISQKFSQYKSKILLKEYNQLQKDAIIKENQKLVVSHSISLLPLSVRGSFIVKQPSTVEECECLLRNEFNYSHQNPHQSPMLKDKLNIPPIQNNHQNEIPPWTIPKSGLILELTTPSRKDETNPEYYRRSFNKLQAEMINHDFIYTDGTKQNNQTGAAVVTKNETYHYHLPSTTSIFSAEAEAIKRALETTLQNNETNKNKVICSDSYGVILNISKLYPKNCIIQKIQNLITELRNKNTKITFIWTPSHVGIAGNEKADAAAKTALQDPEIDTPIQTYDIIAEMKTKLKIFWTQKWTNITNNKLREIQQDVRKREQHGSRREQVILTRLRIGHTRLTNSHLFTKSDPPICTECNKQITIKHIIEECPLYASERREHHIPTTISEALNHSTTTEENMLKFTKTINIYNKL